MFWRSSGNTLMCNRSGYYRRKTQHSVRVSVSKCWTLAVLSAEVVAKRQPSGEMWQERMAPWWASMSCSFSPLSVSHILRQTTRTQRSLCIRLRMLLKHSEKCVNFTLTVPSKDQDSSLMSEGELESSEKCLTCSLWPCSVLHSPNRHLHTYERTWDRENSGEIKPISTLTNFWSVRANLTEELDVIKCIF